MNTQLAEREINVIEEISKNPTIDQRTIAKNIGLSLGLTNLIIKKLVKTGYIKIKQLNKRKIQYILTPKGLAEKTKKTYNYILKTTNHFLNIYTKLKDLILKSAKEGKTTFYILTNDEIYQLLELIFKTLNIKTLKYKRITELPTKLENKNTIYLTTYFIKTETENVIDLTRYLS